MKKFYSWYKKHITAAIFTGLILGIITGLFLARGDLWIIDIIVITDENTV